MTVPIRPPDRERRIPKLPRILSPDEFDQAQTLTPSGLEKAEFPVVPAPLRAPAPSAVASDATRVGADPSAQPHPLTGLARILTQYVAEPLMDHPLMFAVTAPLPGAGYVYSAMMGKDVLEYSAQKAAEMSLPPDVRKLAEADPERIPGERAAVEAVMLGAAPAIQAVLKAMKGAAPATATSVVPLTPAPSPLVEPSPGALAAEGAGRASFPITALDVAEHASAKGVSVAEAGATLRQEGYGVTEGMIDQAHGMVHRTEGSGPGGLPTAAEIREKYGETFEDQRARMIAETEASAAARRATSPATAQGAPAGPPAAPSPLAAAQAAMRGHAAKIQDAWQQMFSPANRSPQAGEAANILRATTGEMARNYEVAAFKLDEFRRAIEPLPEVDKLGFIDAIEGGRSQASPEFAEAAATIRETLDSARESIRALGTGKLEHFIEDYFPHIWDDPLKAMEAFRAAREQTGTAVDVAPEGVVPEGVPVADVTAPTGAGLERAKVTLGSQRPMEGPKSFLKHRSIPTTAEGMAMGLRPVSTNPVDLTLLKLREMQRYYMAHTSLSEMKAAGLVEYVRAGSKAPDGYVRINDKIATVFGPHEGAVTLPEGAVKAVSYEGGAEGGVVRAEPVLPEDVGVMGMRIMGEYWAPEPVAAVVNNYLSPGLRGNAIYDAYRGLGNTLNQAQLGLSAFHLMFTSMDASVSRAALGIEYIASGSPLKGLREIVSVPAAPVTNIRLGAKVRLAYLHPETATPEMAALAHAVQEAGGRVRMDSFYRNSAPERMIKAWREGEYGKATALSLPSLFEMASKPIMEYIVPRQKLGVFADLARKTLAELPPEAPIADRRAALARAWDSVDNRMGQLVYDNLFWNKTFKDMAMASVRSVGWNIGTIRELGGGLVDVASSTAKVARGERFDMTHSAAYVAALPITVGFYSAIYQYLRTGEGPQEMKDYFFPRTGEVDADGNPERVQIASYMKDFFAYSGHPWQTVKHKLNPIVSTVYEMLQNQDFYGDQIRNPNDPAVRQVAQEAKYIAKSLTPFSFRGMQEGVQRGDQTTITKLGNWFGITPAPRSAVRTEAQNKMAEFLAERRMSGATPDDAEARRSRSEILAGLRGNKGVDLEEAVTDAIERHQLTAKDVVVLLRRAGTTPAQERFKRLSMSQAIQVFKSSTPREKALFAEALLNKVERAQKASN